ncbi:response regulator [Phreatobacter stygius]|uniref:Response regulator n=1 Tax=Phreatobacter stygius TaxID=1940610 RepID=A0A4D7B4U5_9HYPH|nr:response regulator [Phreatobacter stygius]QCI68444.1 response regulator [Phreatobacter stygius]
MKLAAGRDEHPDIEVVTVPPWTILIADDSAFWRGLIRAGIEAFDRAATVIEAKNGQEALDALSEHPVDIAFVDLAMPEIDGTEVVERVRHHGKMPFFVVVSVTSDAQAIARMRKLAAYDYLVKPFGSEAITPVLQTFERVSQPTRILIVDDSGTARAIVTRILSHSIFNLTVDQAGDGVTALENYAREGADIVFLDMNMPWIDGASTLRLLRAVNRHVRVVLMSASSDIAERAQELGAAACLRKPFFASDLDRAVHQLFELRLPYSE